MINFLTVEEYKAQSDLLTDDAVIQKYIKEATQDINTLTFNRIALKADYDSLNSFQNDILTDVMVGFVNFKYENRDNDSGLIKSYKIDGVTIQYEDKNLITFENGVTIPSRLYKLLEQTGLICLILR